MKLASLLYKHLDRFSLRGEGMEKTDTVMHEVDTGSASPFRERLRNYSPSVQQIIDAEVKKMLDDNIIQPSKSPYASNLLLVRKPDPSSAGGVKNRVCASFVQLNKQTIKDSYPLPNIQVIFDKIGRSKWFTTMDLLNGFWQVIIKPEHRYKTAFITSRGLYEFVVMAFGLCNAPATFQRLMDTVIKPEYRTFIETYIDDVIIHSTSFDDHLQHLDVLLSTLREHKLVVKLSKCKFAQLQVKFLGHIISEAQLRPNPESVEAVLKWQRPTQGSNKVKAIRGFLGMVGWYRKFIPNFATIARPLFDLTKKNVKWDWTNECEQAFIILRDALTKEPVLTIANPNKRYILHTDASDHAFGAILMQEDEECSIHPVAYASVTLNQAQRNYSVTEREAMAIPWALEHFNTYLEGHKYTAITDHAALRYLWNNKDKTPRLLRALIRLQPYEIELYYKPGSQNYAADLLSRSNEMMEINNNGKRIVSSKTKNKPRIQPRRRPIDIQYDVEAIVDKRLKDGSNDQYLYYVKWLGYDEAQNTWEPIEHLQNAMNKVAEFESKRQLKEIEQQVLNKENPVQDVDISEEAIARERYNRMHVCNQCSKQLPTITSLYVHKFKEHSIPIPVPSLQLGVVEERVEVLREMQQKESEFKVIYEHLKGNSLSDDATLSERKMLSLNEFCMNSDSVLFCVDSPSSRARSRVRTRMRICIPKPMRLSILKEAHEGILSPHPGVMHMYDKLRECVWWPAMLNDIIAYVKTCEKCQQRKQHMRHAPLLPVTVPSGPWQYIGVDITGPFPITQRNNQYVLVVVDHFTRWAEAFAIPDQTTETIADRLLTGIICRYGLPRVIVSDRGSSFVSKLAKIIYAMLGIKRVTTTAWHPQSNGIVERFNGTLKVTLSMWVNEMHNDWDLLLPYALFAYNVSVHRVLQETPFYLTFGRDALLPIDFIVTDTIDDGGNVSAHEYATELVRKLKDVHTRVTDILNNINEDRTNAIDDQEVSDIVVGDLVWLYKPTTGKGKSRKLTRRWTGPYTVVAIHSRTTYVIEKDEKQQVVHVNRLKKAYKDGGSSIQSYESQLQLAQSELESVSQAQQDMVLRQIDVQQRVAQLQALIQAQHNDQVHDDEMSMKTTDTNCTFFVSFTELYDL